MIQKLKGREFESQQRILHGTFICFEDQKEGVLSSLNQKYLTLLSPIVFYIFNGPSPASFSFIFGLFKQTTIFTTNQCG